MDSIEQRRDACWKALREQAPCVECGHGRAQHQTVAGRRVSAPKHCNECPCAFYIAAHPGGEGKVMVITREQLIEGYPRNPYSRIPSNVIDSDRCQFQAIRKLEDGTYLVKDPS